MKKSLRSYYIYDMKLEYKLLLSHLTLSVLAILLLAALLYTSSARLLEKKLLNSAEATSEKTVLSLENLIQKYDNMTYSFSMMGTLTDIFSHAQGEYGYDSIRRDRMNFETAMYSCIPIQIRNSVPECDIRVYFDDSFPYFNNSTRYFTYSSISQEQWFSRIYDGYMQDRTSFFLIAPEEMPENEGSDAPFFSIARVMLDKNYYPTPLAVIRLDFQEEYLQEIINPNNFDEALTLLVSDDTKNLVVGSSSEAASLYKKLKEASGRDLFLTDSWERYQIGRSDYFVICQPLPSYSMTLITMLPSKDLLSDYYFHRNFTLIIGGVLLVLCLLFSTILAKTMSGRIARLTSRMKQVKKGELIPLPEALIKGTDEIGELTETYNFMVQNMKELIEKEYQLGKETKNAELKVLQAQINPHFLYNILDMIEWFAEEGMISEIQEAVSSLASFYRLSLSNGREFISLREEVAHVRSYISLQKLRFPDTFVYEELLDEALLDIQIPKTTLQPLVENAIIHGLQESRRIPGHLCLKIERENDTAIRIFIIDDGAGLKAPPEKILSAGAQSGKNGHGFGIHNVASRLTLLYGTEYGLSLLPNEPSGTTAIIRLPFDAGL